MDFSEKVAWMRESVRKSLALHDVDLDSARSHHVVPSLQSTLDIMDSHHDEWYSLSSSRFK